MGVFDGLRAWRTTFGAPRVVDLRDDTAGGIVHDPARGMNLTRAEIQELMRKVGAFSAGKLFETQPNLRACVDFVSRNVAQVGVHVYRRDDDDGRERDRDGNMARVLANPSPVQTEYELLYSIVADLAVYDDAWLWLTPVPKAVHPTGYILRPLPVTALAHVSGSEWTGDLVLELDLGGDSRPIRIEGSELVHFSGWNPAYGLTGVPPIEALKGVLSEQIAAQAYRLGVWKNGGQAASYIYRPKDAPEWGPKGKHRFAEDMRAFRAGGGMAGGMPLLEDGMEIRTNRLTAKEEQFVEAAALSLETCARVYMINPAMLGATGGVTYANMREFRKMLYGETLGPILEKLAQKLTTKLGPMLGEDPARVYAEFNIETKLAGSFEEQAEVLSKAVGGAGWLKVDEARSRMNLPLLPDGAGDVVLGPLNMVPLGTEPAAPAAPPAEDDPPAVEPPATRSAIAGPAKGGAGRLVVKAAPKDPQYGPELIRGAIERHAERQRAAVLSKLGAKAADRAWWDQERWDSELTDDLVKAAAAVSAAVGDQVAADLGRNGAYSLADTLGFLQRFAEVRAHWINTTTYEQLVAAVDAGEDPAHVFDLLATSRGDEAAATVTTALVGWTGVEAARQVARRATPEDEPPARSTKTWIVNSTKPRPAHAKMNGQTVGIDEKFSNGADWPGDAVLGAAGVSNCRCSVEVSVEFPG